ncbi:MAG: DUF2752 domain-containing protein [Bacteroidales bacterium]|jgi:hypothetical protein|nr:DUF2752 domain-containing protein [Bacteroidales bacterium]
MNSRQLYILFTALCIGGYSWLFYSFSLGQRADIILCPSKLFFHLSCPGCGTTRACIYLCQGHIGKALLLNPNCLIVLAASCILPILLIHDFVLRRHLLVDVYKYIEGKLHKPYFWIPILIFESLIWIHNLILGI